MLTEPPEADQQTDGRFYVLFPLDKIHPEDLESVLSERREFRIERLPEELAEVMTEARQRTVRRN